MSEEALDFLLRKAKMKQEEVSNKPAIMERVCKDFMPSSYSEDVCGQCGHDDSAHEEHQSSGGGYRIVSDGMTSRIVHAHQIDEKLNAGMYVLKMNQSGFYLDHSEPFKMPKKIYGSSPEKVDRILKMYGSRSRSMGAMCSGRPGTGKTILAKMVANKAIEMGMPVILVRQGFNGSGMATFLETLPNNCILFVDEVEKVYEDKGARNWLLTVLDGTVKSSHLWIMTCNNPDIGEAFYNRPSRIRYHYKFEGLEEELIKGMIDENLRNKEKYDNVVAFCLRIPELTPDVLMTIIEEVNLFDELPRNFISFLNVETSLPRTFDISGIIPMPKKASIESFKEGISGVSKKQVDAFLYDLNNYGLMSAINEYPEVAKHIQYEKKEVEQKFADLPISLTREGSLRICCRVYEKGLPFSLQNKSEVGVDWSPDDMEPIEMDGSTYIARHKQSGAVLRLTPSRTKAYAYSTD